MLLTVDAGNTNLNLGAFIGDEPEFVSRLATDRTVTADKMAVDIINIFSLYNINRRIFSGAAISSVVPEITDAISEAVRKVTGREPLLVQSGLDVPLKTSVDNPSALGADMAIGAVAAISEYELPCLVMDLGTATKISVIDDCGVYRGCTISPGVELSLKALTKGASQLSQISLLPPEHVIGTNTIDCMRSGSVFGTAAMLDGLCDRIELELGLPVKTVAATGGHCAVAEFCSRSVIINQNLLLEGLKKVYELR